MHMYAARVREDEYPLFRRYTPFYTRNYLNFRDDYHFHFHFKISVIFRGCPPPRPQNTYLRTFMLDLHRALRCANVLMYYIFTSFVVSVCECVYAGFYGFTVSFVDFLSRCSFDFEVKCKRCGV